LIMRILTSSQFDKTVNLIKSLVFITITLLIVYFVLRLSLSFFRKKNNKLNQQRDNIVKGQVCYVFQNVSPGNAGYIICETEDGVRFSEAVADLEIKEGTAVVVISSHKNVCKIKPLVSRVKPK
jgi:membrane protein implicated in regulation of membrane protease activity